MTVSMSAIDFGLSLGTLLLLASVALTVWRVGLCICRALVSLTRILDDRRFEVGVTAVPLADAEIEEPDDDWLRGGREVA